MSIATAISALQSASSDIASAISAKGVTVPSGSGFDDYASLIASIPQDGGGGGSTLPYTPLEYIETDGVAYINSGVIAKEPMIFDLKVKMNTSSHGEVVVGVGNSDGNANTLNGLWRSSSNQTKIGYGYYYMYSGILTPTSFENPIYVSTSLRNGNCVMGYKVEGGTSYTSATNSRTRAVTTSLPLFLFASNVNGSPSNMCPSGTRIYHVKICCGSSFPMVAFDGVPALYNGEYGLWDRVSNTFFGNAAGSGSFTGA